MRPPHEIVYVRPVALFFVSSPGGFALYIFILIRTRLLTLCFLVWYPPIFFFGCDRGAVRSFD
jgi:hypothetical protein